MFYYVPQYCLFESGMISMLKVDFCSR